MSSRLGGMRYARRVTTRRLLSFAVLLATLGAGGVAAGDLPRLPGSGGATPPATASAAGTTSGALTPERLRQALVAVEVGGRATGVGVVLEGDGRILTALSALGTGDTADVRYADGHTVHARVGHKDATWDLALLVPLSGRYTKGLLASELDPLTETLRTAPLVGGRPSVGAAKLKGDAVVHAKDGTGLPGAIELEGRAPTSGAPLIDPEGRAMGIAARACRNGDAAVCSETTIIVPIRAIRIFLSRTPANAVPPSPWLGINGAPDVANGIRGVRVQAVAPRSPAQRGGLKGGDAAQADLIVVADGQPIDTPERLAEIVSKHAVGDTLKLSVFANGRYREVNITLQAPP
jgi:serine protease Do